MNVTANDIAEGARTAISVLAEAPEYGTLTAVYDELHQVSGLSVSWLAKFYQKAKRNPTVDTLDRLVAAIDMIARRRAA